MDVATDFFLDNGLDTLDDCSSEFREAFVNVWEDQRAIAVVGYVSKANVPTMSH